jgi:hypothetical protein
MFHEFRTHLKSIERAFDIDFWADTSIHAGHQWNTAIQQAIAAAEIIVLLISPDFIASDYIYEQEAPAVATRRRTGALVLPILLHRCYWKLVCDTVQAAPIVSGRLLPIADWHPRRDGYDCAREQIAAAVEHRYGRSPQSSALAAP